ncbi:hypothetical protein FDENT_5693 [Fusarium denticulatum]|uniref:Vault poly n=1 Tax=Fusarium denticulatum TaxID=48507 RepID=A0A8H5X9Z5_9HYPO|nr:hypothetical protein FDENT_5693 [Fusarium denticulatum]
MASRHVFTQRLKSGVIFSAPGNLLAMPEGGWGDDTPMTRQKKPKRKVQGRALDHFSHWVAKVTPYDQPYDNVDSFAPGKDPRGIENEYRPYSIPPLPEPEVEAAVAKIPEMTLCLPMLSVSLTATVDGTVARTELVQKFHNPSDIIIDAAKHVFPLYDGAVITSFECTIGDERRVRGVVKPKVQARKEFEEAVRDKVAAPALLEEHTPEIFETSLGNIPANTTVEIKITYVQELKIVMMESEATEGIALTIPMSIAPRYSKAPIEWEPASRVPEERLDIWIKVMDNGKVNQEGCEEESGHLLQFEGSKPSEYSNLLDKDASPKTYYVWHHESEPPVLRKDFVFVIQMNEGHQIKSGAIACPADDKGFAALKVNIRPNDLFRNAIIPQSFTGEILFLLDQSGSMEWANSSPDYYSRRKGPRKIDVMREAMLLALSGIPSTCVFNIISWGSATMGLWESSRAHTRENIREAKSYVSQIEADMGGTDLLRALESVVKRRAKDKSTQIIILTDGELEPEDSIQFIWKKRQLFGDSIRFFALGIGDEVSHRLVESIAECGGGYSDVVHTTQTPRWHDRLNRLLRSALEPNSWSCDIELGSGFERKSLIDYELHQEATAESGKALYIQGPFPISSLHPFSFASISFLIDLHHGGQLPQAVTINTTTAGAKKKTYELPIEQAPGNDGTIHRLVAKSVLLDLQDQIKRGATETQIAKANAESIGTMYSITSKWTSFVAISEDQPSQTVEEQKMNHYRALLDEIDIDELLNNVSDDGSSSCGSSSGYGARISFQMHGAGTQFCHAGQGNMNSISRHSYQVNSPVSTAPMYNYPMTGRVLESASGIPIPAPMPRPLAPARPSPGLLPTPRFMGRSQNDEPKALGPASSPVAHDPEQEEPQGSGNRIESRNSRPRTHSASGPRPWEAHAFSEATNVSDDVRLPTRERVHEGDSSASIGQDFPLYPNDSDWQEVEKSERTRAETTDDIQPAWTPLMAELAEPPEVAAVVAKPPSGESYATPRSYKSAYSVPAGSCRPRRRYAYDSEGNSDDDTAQEYRQRRQEPTKEEVAEEPVAASDANHGIAIATANTKPEEPQVLNGGPAARLRARLVPSRSSRYKTTRNPPVVSSCQDVPCSHSPVGEDHQIITHKPLPLLSDPFLPRLEPHSVTSNNIPNGPKFQNHKDLTTQIPPPPPPLGSHGSGGEALSATYIPSGYTSPLPYPAASRPRSSPLRAVSSSGDSFEPPPGDPGRKGIEVQLDSYHEEGSQSSFDSTPHQHESHNPLDWQVAMECQDGHGLFELTGQARETLRLHFCQETDGKLGPRIAELVGNSPAQDQEDGEGVGRYDIGSGT